MTPIEEMTLCILCRREILEKDPLVDMKDERICHLACFQGLSDDGLADFFEDFGQ